MKAEKGRRVSVYIGKDGAIAERLETMRREE